jgi:hypothetical protein
MRIETHALTFGTSPVGILINGSDAKHYAEILKQFLRTCDTTGVRVPVDLLVLIQDLERAREDEATRLKPYAECQHNFVPEIE